MDRTKNDEGCPHPPWEIIRADRWKRTRSVKMRPHNCFDIFLNKCFHLLIGCKKNQEHYNSQIGVKISNPLWELPAGPWCCPTRSGLSPPSGPLARPRRGTLHPPRCPHRSARPPVVRQRNQWSAGVWMPNALRAAWVFSTNNFAENFFGSIYL